jgi:hypothetical protein
VLSLLLAAHPASANDASFGGTGADLVPLKETRVQMRSERIVLRYEGDWVVEANYVFFNTSQSDIKLQVGFPELRCMLGPDCQDADFKKLRTEVNGAPVEHRQGELSSAPKRSAKTLGLSNFLGVIWLFDVNFPTQQPVHIRHTYRMRGGSTNYWDEFTAYLTRTGALWAGDIGLARFEVQLPPWAHSVSATQGIALKGIRTVESQGAAPYTEVVYEQANWVPDGDLFFSFNGSAEFAMSRLASDAHQKAGLTQDAACPDLPPDFETLTPAQRQACINMIYAARGYPFASQQLRDYYYADSYDWKLTAHPRNDDGSQWWTRGLRPFTQFDRSWISFPDDDFLRLFEESGEAPVPDRGMPNASRTQPAHSASAPVTPPPSSAVAPPPPVPQGSRCNCKLGARNPASALSAWSWLALSALLCDRRRSKTDPS